MKGIIYYTNNRLSAPIFSIVQKYILASGLPIVSSSFKPIDFGDNEVFEGTPSYLTMIKQITSCLQRSTSDYVFFCEHDVLYPKSHFDFTPLRDDIFYYNENVWRWKYLSNSAIGYDRLISLSGLVANKNLVLNHYKNRLKKIEEMGDEKNGRDPYWARKWGYEPGTKKRRRGGFSDDDFEIWKSKDPIIDIRHPQTFSPTKVTLKEFRHQPIGWKEINIEDIPGWNLKQLFGF
jgi:hypothetical protein